MPELHIEAGNGSGAIYYFAMAVFNEFVLFLITPVQGNIKEEIT